MSRATCTSNGFASTATIERAPLRRATSTSWPYRTAQPGHAHPVAGGREWQQAGNRHTPGQPGHGNRVQVITIDSQPRLLGKLPREGQAQARSRADCRPFHHIHPAEGVGLLSTWRLP